VCKALKVKVASLKYVWTAVENLCVRTCLFSVAPFWSHAVFISCAIMEPYINEMIY